MFQYEVPAGATREFYVSPMPNLNIGDYHATVVARSYVGNEIVGSIEVCVSVKPKYEFSPHSYIFDDLTVGYTAEDITSREVTYTNYQSGSMYAPLHVKEGNENDFVVPETSIPANSSATISVAPALGLSMGVHTTVYYIENNHLTLSVTVKGAPVFSGPTEMTLEEGYAATKTDAITYEAYPAATVAVADSDKITWNSAGYFEIAAGLEFGIYPVSITAENSEGSSTHTFVLTVTKQQEKPTAIFTATSADSGTLSGLASGMKYRIDSGEWVSAESESVSLEEFSPCAITVYMPGNGTTLSDSEEQVILVTQAETPNLTVTQPTTIGGKGSIAMTAGIHEYKLAADSTWTTAAGTTELPVGTYDVRVKAAGTVLASASSSYTIAAYDAAKETTPSIAIDYANEKLTGFGTGSYTICGINVLPDANGTLAIDSAWFGASLSIVKSGNGTTTADSLDQSLAIPARPTLSGVSKTDCTTLANNDGKLTGITDAMEYKIDDGGWIDGTGSEITGIASGTTYTVCAKSTAGSFASEESSFIIAAYDAIKEIMPNIAIDYANEALTCFGTGSYTIGGVRVFPDADGMLAINNTWFGTTLNIMQSGNGTTTTDSDAQSLVIPARPSLSGVSKSNCSMLANNDGKLTGITVAMEYKIGDGGWINGTGSDITSIHAGTTYTVRVRSPDNNFASMPSDFTIAVYEAIFTITFDPNGSIVIPASAVTDADGTLAWLPTPTNSLNYSFIGWFTAAIGGSPATTSTVFTDDATIYAHWIYNGGIIVPPSYIYYVITASAGTGGTISPSGSASALAGSSVTYTITQDTGYVIDKVAVDDVSVGAVSSYTFANIEKDHVISATFKETNY